jgi:hypothetical protein
MIDDALPVLANEVAELAEPVVLVLDDYQLIRTPEIHEQLAVFVDHLPRISNSQWTRGRHRRCRSVDFTCNARSTRSVPPNFASTRRRPRPF